MKKLSFIVFVFSLLLLSCSSDNNDNDPEVKSSEDLEKMYDEIVELSLVNSQPCTNPDDWGFTLINSNGCGAHAGFIPYSKKTNTVLFLAKVKKYQESKVAFEAKMNIALPCYMIVAPTGIDCVDGKPVLTYGPVFN